MARDMPRACPNTYGQAWKEIMIKIRLIRLEFVKIVNHTKISIVGFENILV